MSTRAPITHELKCWPGPFASAKSGAKPFEWRKDDRDYRVGDTLRLMEWDPTVEVEGIEGEPPDIVGYTGHVEYRRVTYIIREGFGIPPGYCIMGLSELEAQPSQTEDLEARASSAIDRIREIAGTRIASDLPMMDPAITEIRALSGRVQHFFTMRSRSLPQPSAPTVEQMVDVFHGWQTSNHNGWSQDAINADLRARLTKLLTNK